jgi:two-component system CheB/CheR fusion protein
MFDEASMNGKKKEPDFSSQQFEKIVALLRSWNRFDMHAYKEQTVFRRLARRVSMVGCNSADEYIDYLERTPSEIEALFNDLLIEVTSFFRDFEAFVSLQKNVIQNLPNKDVDELRIWVPACATGQEAYSIAILLAEAINETQREISFSSAGVYSNEMLAELPEELRKRYFYSIDENRCRIHPRLRSRISFFRHNILADPPFPYIDLICCRNLLIYLKPEFQQQVISTFHFSLRENGVLFLGTSESLSSLNHGFHQIDSRWRIYSKNSEVRLPFEAHRLKPEPVQVNRFNADGRSERLSPNARLIDIYDSLMSKKCVPGIIVDCRYEIIHINGDVMKYFPTVRGRLTSQLLEWAEGELRISLSTALARARKINAEVSVENVRLMLNGELKCCEISVCPFSLKNEVYYFVQVCEKGDFEEQNAEKFAFNLDEEAQNRIENLEIEVKELQNSLYCAIEEKKSSQEELQASNEELRASNEELQSSNEELHAISLEHEEKIRELISVNNDFKNLLISTDLALVFLDQNLRIRRFTPVAEKLLRLSSQDIDRSFTSIRSELIDIDSLEMPDKLLIMAIHLNARLKGVTGKLFFFACCLIETNLSLSRG